MKKMISVLTLVLTTTAAQAQNPVPVKPRIVLVHGAFTDGSGWEGVYRVLTKDQYEVTVVQNPTSSLAADVTATQNVLASLPDQAGSVVLVGHSYGGEVITQAGDDPKVKSLVYVAAYAPDKGESLQTWISNADPSIPAPPILASPTGFLIKRDEFPAAFAADVDPEKARFMADAQIPLGVSTFTDSISTVAWKTKPSYYIVSGDDRMIPPADERKMAARAGSVVREIKASHAGFISHPEDVAKVIEEAAAVTSVPAPAPTPTPELSPTF